MFATGRAPRTADVGREAAGLTPGAWLTAADAGRVTAVADGWICAVGHVNGGAPMTHLGVGRPAGAHQYAEDCRGRARMPIDAADGAVAWRAALVSSSSGALARRRDPGVLTTARYVRPWHNRRPVY
ncbi:hypothetical protein [Streptomyces sp. NPDC047841]|uniref:hypothetical protein n=1 Tax=Streptomyces sp. NPDC047841 TaxID=3154708 RepID=UPI003453028B